VVDVGKGRFAPGHITWLLQNRDRKKAGVTAPACGLCLMKVFYPQDIVIQPAVF
jgi:tRNA pseudouridine38-40 synthase